VSLLLVSVDTSGPLNRQKQESTIPVLITHFFRTNHYRTIAICKVIRSKLQPRTRHEGPDEGRDSYTLSLTSALNGVGSQRHAPAALPAGIFALLDSTILPTIPSILHSILYSTTTFHRSLQPALLATSN
jgi:hypothetical protein